MIHFMLYPFVCLLFGENDSQIFFVRAYFFFLLGRRTGKRGHSQGTCPLVHREREGVQSSH